MTNERFFRMLSVAVMGLLALAVVPETNATDSQTEVSIEQLPVEVTVVREIEVINAGRFNTAQAGERDIVTESEALTDFDPNL